MFGIGLPEMILIMALALIVVGPDKLPDLARSLAKGLLELKKTAEGLKESLKEEGNPLDEIKPDLEEAANNLKKNLLDIPPYQREEKKAGAATSPAENAAKAYQELMQQSSGSSGKPAAKADVGASADKAEKQDAVQQPQQTTDAQPEPTNPDPSQSKG